jgi:hypothetical protein
MGALADQLNGMVVEATSPDGQIFARVRGQGTAVEVAFRRHAYRRYTERVLGEQLARLAALIFVGYRRGEQGIVESAFATGGDGSDLAPERRRYLDAVERLTAVGASDDGQLRIATRCLVTWEVAIADGTLLRLPEREFLAALLTAVRRLLSHYDAQVFALKDEIYDLGYPNSLRQAVGLGPRGGTRRHEW